MIDSVVGRVEEHVGAGGSRFSVLILERWHCAHCFTVEGGSPGILKSMSSSIISRINSLSVLSIVISRYTSGASCRLIVCLSGCPDRS